MRQPNILDLQPYRRAKHNPIFDLLTNEFSDYFLEEKIDEIFIANNLFVDSRSRESVTNEKLFELFQHRPKIIVKGSELSDHMNYSAGMVYLLLGKKGIGKTIFLRRYLSEMQNKKKYLITNNDVIVYLDLRTKKQDNNFLQSLPDSLLEEIFYFLKNNNISISSYLSIPDKIREIDDSYKYIKSDNTLEKRVLDHKIEAMKFLLQWTKKNRINTQIIVDNVDDLPVQAIKQIIDKCLELRNNYNSRCIIALRDYWHPTNLKISDTNISSCYLGKPDIQNIIKKRLLSIDIKNINKKLIFNYSGKELVVDSIEIIDIFNNISRNLIDNDNQLHEILYQLANYNTREYLHNIFNFYHSPYLFTMPNFINCLINKMKEIDKYFEIEIPRSMKLYDYIEGFMCVHSLCYDYIASKIFNIFYHPWSYSEGYNYKNTLLFLRILQMFPRRPECISKKMIVENLQAVGYSEEPIRDAIDKLLQSALIESIEGTYEKDVTNVFISSKGLCYINNLIYEYNYLVYVCDAVPMPDEYKVNILKKYGSEYIPLAKGNFIAKNESVRKFLKFLLEEEETERMNCRKDYITVLNRFNKDGNLSKEILDRIEETIARMNKYGRKKVNKIESIHLINNK